MGNAQPSERGPLARVARRGFLGTLGAGGLTAALAVFGKDGAEAAVKPDATCGCCNLIYCPPNTSYSSCNSVSHYMWECTMTSGFEYCYCCEKKNKSGGYTASGYQCQYS